MRKRNDETAMIDTMQIAAKNQVGMIIDEHKKLSGFQSTVFKWQEIIRNAFQ